MEASSIVVTRTALYEQVWTNPMLKLAAEYRITGLQGPQLHTVTVSDIRPHIPTDNERGKWANVLIPVVQQPLRSSGS